MKPNDAEITIGSREYWFKVVEFLQQNWALIDAAETGVVVWFIGDSSGVFDELAFPSHEEAVHALQRNGFRPYAEDPEAQEFLVAPKPPFTRQPNPNGPIYSIGRYWM